MKRLDTLTVAHTRAPIKGAMPLERPEYLEKLAELMRFTSAGVMERKIARLKIHPFDPVSRPVTRALANEYLRRLETYLALILNGAAGMREKSLIYPGLPQELMEIEDWLLRSGGATNERIFKPEIEDFFGNWLVSIGYSYTETKQMLGDMRKELSGRGAPSKRPETLRILDARIANGWSYSRLAAEMCDCGAKQHTTHCAERIRKRLKELESFLSRYKIVYSK